MTTGNFVLGLVLGLVGLILVIGMIPVTVGLKIKENLRDASGSYCFLEIQIWIMSAISSIDSAQPFLTHLDMTCVMPARKKLDT